MAIIRPRLVDYYNIPVTQEEVSFAIPFLDEDIPLYLDPFLLWKSPSQQDNALHISLLNSFNQLGFLSEKGHMDTAAQTLIELSECREAGLGNGRTKRGLKISSKTALEILSLYRDVPQIRENGFYHFEEIQLLVNNISKDRISDISCGLLKSFLVDYTQDECMKYSIPMEKFTDLPIYNNRTFKQEPETVDLPYNPETNSPIIFIPKRWLRYSPWINYDEYFEKAYVKQYTDLQKSKINILDYNRQNYDMVSAFVSLKERKKSDCRNDPLFKQIPVISAQKCLNGILKLPTGKNENADKKYENYCTKLMASLLYPHLDFAQPQSRIESGSQIRDLIFYNNCSYPFLEDLYKHYECRQIVFEMKNVNELSREHINQINRYLSDQFGRFGVILTRNPPKKNIFKNTIDLWAGQRRCIICLTDSDVQMMANVYESKQRDPIEVIKKKYVEFIRACPA